MALTLKKKSIWKQVILGELFRIKHGFAFKGDFFSEGGDYILLTPGNFVEEGGLKLKGEKEKYYIGEFPEEYLLKKGDLLVVLTDLKQTAPILGASGFILKNNKFLHNQRLGKIVDLDKSIVDINFLYYLFNYDQVRGQIKGSATGSTVRHTSPERIYEVKISLPSLPVQRKIAGILSAYDRLIENNTRRIKILEEMAQSLYREWFVNFRFPGYEQTKLVNSELGLIPESWEIKPLSEVCLRITDGSHFSPKTVDDGYSMASVKDMHEWGFHINQCRKISEEDYKELVRNNCKPLKNDVLVAKDGSYLKHIFVMEKEFQLVILSSIALLRPNEKILPHVLSFYLLQPSIKARMAGYVSGVALPRIILKDFRKFPIALPPFTLQKQFFQLAEPTITNCYRLIEKNSNLRQTRDLLLPKLISGEIDVENLNIESETTAA